MQPIMLRKIDNFGRRHLLLSSFLFLLILGTILEFFGIYASTARSSSLDGGIENIIFSAKWSIFGIWVWVIPVFLFSLLLCSFLKKKGSHNARLSFSRKFVLGSIPALSIILLISVWIVEDTPRPFASNPMYLYPLAIFISCFYGAVFGAFFGWQSKVSRAGIIVQSISLNLLMGVYYIFLYALSQISM